MTFPNLMAAAAAPWAVRPDSLPQLRALLATAKQPPAELTAAMETGRPGMGALARGVAVLPVRGFLLNRCNPFEEYFGCCSVERLSASLDMLLADEAVTAIALSFDSPGGSVLGIEELSRKILSVRDSKPIVAAVDALSASAAYWIASACSEIWCTPSGMVGSIGTLMVRYDFSAANAEAGVAVNVITAGTYKAEGIPDLPMTEEEKAAVQAMCDSYYSLFTATIAKGRETTTSAVRSGFGEGRVVTAKDALAEGMVDKVGTMGDVLGKYAGRSKGGVRALSAAPTGLALLAAPQGIAAKTPMDVVAAIGGILTRPTLVAVKADEDPPKDDDETDEEYEARKAKAKATAAKADDQDETDEGASASAALTPPATAPQAKESAMPEPTNGAAPTSGADATQMNQRSDAIMALALKHGKDMPWAIAQAKSGRTVEQIQVGLEMMAEMRTKLENGPDISPRGHVGGPNTSGAEPNIAAKPFRSFGEQLGAIRRVGAAAKIGNPTQSDDLARLNSINAAVSGMNEGTGSDGGFAVQTEFLPGITEPIYNTGQIASRVLRIPSSSPSVKFNVVDETTRASGSRWGGVQFQFAPEGGQGSATRPKLREVLLTARKAFGLWYATDELLADSPAMGALADKAFSTELQFFVEDQFVNGIGGGAPLGIIPAPCTVAQAIEATQTIANSPTFIVANVSKMKSRFGGNYQNAVWLANQELEPTFIQATLGGTSAAFPVYMPQGGLSAAPFASLLGRPLIFVDYCAAVGTPGDLILADLSQYATLDRGGVESASSIHLRFDYDETAFRMTYRFDGLPIWKQAVTPYKGALTRSPFVTLATRS